MLTVLMFQLRYKDYCDGRCADMYVIDICFHHYFQNLLVAP